MPIAKNVEQTTGVVATYHVVNSANATFGGVAQGSASVASYLSRESFTAGKSFLASSVYDISPMLSNAAQASPLVSQVEQYLLTTPTFAGGEQVS